MKSGVAAGTDGIEEAQLRQAGALTVLTRIMNACLLRNYYPKMWRENRMTSFPSQEGLPVMSAAIGSHIF